MDSFDKWLRKKYYEIVQPEKTNKNPDWFKEIDKWFLHGMHGLLKIETIKHDMILQKRYDCVIFKATRGDVTANYAYMYSDYVCLSPTFKSCDGEYRHRFIRINQVLKQSNILSIAESYVLDEINSGELTLTTISFGGFSAEGLPVLFYVASWLVEYHYFMEGYTENHIVDNYGKIFLLKKYKKLFENIKKSMSSNDFLMLLALLTYLSNDGETVERVEFGQKMIPLTQGDIIHFGDLRYPVWKELHINNIIQDLRINAITPGVPVSAGWFLLDNDKLLFDNQSMRDRIDHSNITKRIVADLKDTIDTNKFVSYKFDGLTKRVNIPIAFAEDQIIMSGNTVVIVMEHIGRTLGDIPKLIKSDIYRKFTGPILTNHALFAKYMFEYIYILACLNTKCGIIHGDLHCNNATMMMMGIPKVENSYIMYDVGKVFVFPFYGRYSGIIDFSRAILSEDKQLDDLYIDHQRRRILKIFKNDLPEFFEKHSDKINILMMQNFPMMFRILTALDSFKISRVIINLFGEAKPKSIALAQKINKIARYYLTDILLRVYNGNLTNIPWVNEVIIDQCFDEFTSDKFAGGNIIDLYRYDTPMKYNSDNLPEMIQWEGLLKHGTEKDKKRFEQFKKLNALL